MYLSSAKFVPYSDSIRSTGIFHTGLPSAVFIPNSAASVRKGTIFWPSIPLREVICRSNRLISGSPLIRLKEPVFSGATGRGLTTIFSGEMTGVTSLAWLMTAGLGTDTSLTISGLAGFGGITSWLVLAGSGLMGKRGESPDTITISFCPLIRDAASGRESYPLKYLESIRHSSINPRPVFCGAEIISSKVLRNSSCRFNNK